MVLHHRHKQRILTTIMTLIALLLGLDAYIFLGPVLDPSVGLLFAFAVSVGVITAYQCYNYRHSHEHLTLVNTLTQIFLGTILFCCSIILLLLHAFFGIDIINALLALSIIVILLTFIFLKSFDQFLEQEVKRITVRTPIPEPKRKKRQVNP